MSIVMQEKECPQLMQITPLPRATLSTAGVASPASQKTRLLACMFFTETGD